jgi:acyl carrier protein
MTTQTDRLQKAFVDGLGLPKDTNFTALAYGVDEKWDSVGHMQLVAELEGAFDIMLDTQDVIAMSSYPVAIEILKKYGVSLDA